MSEKLIYAVLLYPSAGVPRVVELPDIGVEYPLSTFADRKTAEEVLERFFEISPQYRRWKDGRIQ